ncbi:unnamed protein product [Porites lobata]|uniref:Uncharacterized protein n=1 Tax=Porites lobata TaxID=104759 RepID=A0ABN8PWW7_9CNID|nr:unnamed protein product [Porites lobata]
MKSKCKCGDVFGFKIIEALRLIGELEREQALRRFVTSTKRGCAGRLTFPGTGQVSGCIHIQRMQLPESILESLDKAFSSTRNAPTPCNGSSVNVKQQVNAAQAVPVITISENIAVSDQMPGEADPQQVEETNIELQVNANSQGNTTQCEPLKGFFCMC